MSKHELGVALLALEAFARRYGERNEPGRDVAVGGALLSLRG